MVGRRSAAFARLASAVLCAVAAACELDTTRVSEQEGPLVVHAVLNPSTTELTVLVEETLTGRVTVPERATRDTLDPILSWGGVPTRGARVLIFNTKAPFDTSTGYEDAARRPDRRGRGVYRLSNRSRPFFGCVNPTCDVIPIVRGGTYGIRVEHGGRVVTGETTVPELVRGFPQVLGRPEFNRDRDSIVVRLPPVRSSERYELRVGTPYGPFPLFTDSAVLVVRGALRNVFADEFPSAFVPGFQQSVTLGAVDRNYFDYYRSQVNPFSGLGLLNHLEGGTGVFGSYSFLETRRIDVVADLRAGVDGRYVGGATGRDTLALWAGDDVRGTSLLSGSLREVLPNFFGIRRSGVLGSLREGKVAIDVLGSDVRADVRYRLTGQSYADSLVVTSSANGRVLVYRRAR